MEDKKSTRSERLRTASQQRREHEKQEVRQLIVQAATDLFLKYGYENFSLRQVAEQIGYSPGTIYLYFQDKDELLYTIMQEGAAQFSQMLTDAAQVEDRREKLLRVAQAYVDFGLRYPAHYQLMFMQRTDYLVRRDNKSSLTPPEPIIAIFALWRSVIEDAMRAGVLRMGDPGSTGDTLWALLHGVVSIAILMPNFDEKRSREMVATTLELISRGVHNP